MLHVLAGFDVVSVLCLGHSPRCAVVACCFNLRFPDDIRCGTSFHRLIFHLCIVFDEVFVEVFGHFVIGLFVLLCWSFNSSLHILDNSPLSGRSFANLFFQTVACLLILDSVVYKAEILNFNKSRLSIFFSWIEPLVLQPRLRSLSYVVF